MSYRNLAQSAGSKHRVAADTPHLVFRTDPYFGRLVITSLARAVEIDRLQRAIEVSVTWGEFRERIGRGEYKKQFKDCFYTLQPDDDPESIDESEREPSDDAPFTSGSVPGLSDGDYPPWLSQEMHEHVPPEILNQFAREESSVINGLFWVIDPEHKDDMVKALWRAGFAVEERNDLLFW